MMVMNMIMRLQKSRGHTNNKKTKGAGPKKRVREKKNTPSSPEKRAAKKN